MGPLQLRLNSQQRRGQRLRRASLRAPARRALVLVATASISLVTCASGASAHPLRSGSRGAPTLKVSLARWRLPDAVSRAGAAPLGDGRILLIGGLLSSGSSSANVGILSTSTGRFRSVATLASPTHDAGTAVLGRKAFLFGGGESTPFATVEALTLARASAGAGGSSGVVTVTGQLPQVRADDEALTVGKTAYVIGGYDGANGDAAVLATRDGASFSTVVDLPVGVRYPAVAADGGKIFVFGGESVSGGTTSEYSTPAGSTTPPPGQQVAVVQEIDPRTRSARVVGALPHAVQGAAAFELGGRIFLAGGDSYEQGTPPVSGSTIWSFDPATGSFGIAGHLAAPVAYAAVVAWKKAVWLVGGERDGVQVATAQRIVLRR